MNARDTVRIGAYRVGQCRSGTVRYAVRTPDWSTIREPDPGEYLLVTLPAVDDIPEIYLECAVTETCVAGELVYVDIRVPAGFGDVNEVYLAVRAARSAA